MMQQNPTTIMTHDQVTILVCLLEDFFVEDKSS